MDEGGTEAEKEKEESEDRVGGMNEDLKTAEEKWKVWAEKEVQVC